MKLAITGHRPNKLGNEYDMRGPYSEIIRTGVNQCIQEYKPTKMISGMALGVDTIFALMALENDIELTTAIPCKDHEKKWTKEAKAIYKYILTHPLTTVVMVSKEPYTMWCMQRRNEWIVDNCDVLIAAWNGSEGGTKNCMEYAYKKKVDVVLIGIQK